MQAINQKIRLYILTSNICITTQYSHEECVDDAYNVSRLHLKKDLAFYLKCSAEVSIMSLFSFGTKYQIWHDRILSCILFKCSITWKIGFNEAPNIDFFVKIPHRFRNEIFWKSKRKMVTITALIIHPNWTMEDI